MKEKFNYISNSEYLKKIYNNKSIINGYYIIYLLYDYHLSNNKTSNFLNIHFCYFLINYLKNIVSAIYRCSNIKTDSLLLFYYKYILAENIKDYLLEMNEANNNNNSIKHVQFSSVILYYLYQNLIRIKISDMAENQLNYYDYFKNFTIGSKSNLEFLKIGNNIIKIRQEIKQIWDKILILNPFCLEIKREYLSYIKEMLNDDIYYEKELKSYNSFLTFNSDEKNNFYYKLYDTLNSAVLLSEYNDNKIIYSTPNFKKNIILSNESNELTINSLMPNNIEKFHQHLINEALFYSNIEHIFTKQLNNIMIKTRNNTLLNAKLFVKELPNLSYGLIFIIHIEKVINNEFKIVLDRDFKINGYSDETNSLKKENYENYGLMPSFLGVHICSVIPEILLCLTNINNNEENNNIGKDIYLKNKKVNQRGSIYKYTLPSPNKHILDKIDSIIDDIKTNGITINEIISKLEEKDSKKNSNFKYNSNILNDERNIGDKYVDLIREIEYNSRKSIKIEFEIVERSFLNNKYKYYILTINKDIYNYEENNLDQISNNNKRINNKKNSALNPLFFQSDIVDSIYINDNTKRFEKEIKVRKIRKIIEIDDDEKDKDKNNNEQDGQIQKNKVKILEEKEMNTEIIEKIKQKILGNKLKTKYGLIMLYLSIITIIISFICLIYNFLEGENNLTKISNYLQQNLYYNKTRINASHMFITFINLILIKSKLLKEFTYNSISATDVYKEKLKISINNIFDLTKANKNLDEDYYKIFSKYSEIYIKNPYSDNLILINMTNFQILELIISESLHFIYFIDDFLMDNEDFNFFNSLIANIDNLTNYYIYFKFNGFSNYEIEKKISKKFNKIPFVLIFVCIIIVILLIIYSYIIYILTYYEIFFLVKIINSNSKEFEDYLKHYEELKFKLKNLENEEKQNIENEENIDEITRDINEGNEVQHYTVSGENNEENFKVNDKIARKTLKRKIISQHKDNNLEIGNKNNGNSQNDLEDRKSKNAIKKIKNSKKDRAKKIKLIELKKLKLKNMTRLIILQNFISAIKIGLSIVLTVTYYVIQTIYSNIKNNKFIIFNHNIESVQSVFTESFITYFNLKKEILKFAEFYHNNEEKIKNNLMNNYTLKIQNNKNYTSPDFNNLLMEILKDFKTSPGGVEGNISQLFSEDGCEILYNSENDDFKQCQEFWLGVISNGLQQTIIEMGSQFSIILSSFSLINNKMEYLDNIINNKVWKEFDYFVMYYLYDSFQKSSVLLNDLRIKFIDKNDNSYGYIFYSYLIAFSIISSIFIYFVYSLVIFFNEFLNFIAIIPIKILYEDKSINEEIIKLSKYLY